MAHEATQIWEIVDLAVNHKWSIPEFQRGFVWKSTQVRDLAESLWLDYPIGSLLLWNGEGPIRERGTSDSVTPSLWVVDGQQRATALCILFGRKPYWLEDNTWEKTIKKYDIRFDIDAKNSTFFLVANAAIRKTRSNRYIPLSSLLTLDTKKTEHQKFLENLAREIKAQGLCDGMDAMEVYTRLDQVRKIREKEVVKVTISHELEDAVEIFSRLNSKGTRVTEADIYLGIVAAKTPGWVKDTFLPFLKMLTEAGFEISPNLLFRTLTGVGAKKVRFKEIGDDFWVESGIRPAWKKTTKAWESLIHRFRDYGILSNDPMPTQAALVTMVSLEDKFAGEQFEPSLYWFLQASRFGRYSGSGTTSLEEDLRDIEKSNTQVDAIRKLLRRLNHETPLDVEDFKKDYTDSRFGRFLLYLLVYRSKAQNWDSSSHRLAFEGTEILLNFRPQWHHVFPKQYLDGKINKKDEDKIDSLANIAVIGPGINIRIRDKEPMDYISRYEISKEKLTQQFIDEDITQISASGYLEWLDNRAERLVDAGNAFLIELRGDL